MTKPLHAGHAAQSGVTASLLAQVGFTSDPDVVEAPFGYLNALCLPGEAEPEDLGQSLGKYWDLVERGTRVKPYPSCTATHVGIETALGMVRTHGLEGSEVESVELDIRPDFLMRTEPTSGIEGRFSLAFCVSVVFLEGRIGMEHFRDAFVRSPEVQALIRRVKHVPDSKTIRVVLKSGQAFTADLAPLRNLETGDELVGKFRACADGILDHEVQDEVIDRVMAFESEATLTRLMALLQSPA
jgi:2-methylcitrate dehydratase PrpD